MAEARTREWPLAVFTVALQLSCGLALAATVAAWSAAPSAQTRLLARAVFPVALAGTVVSLLHTGRPRSAWRSLANVARSRLSREILLAGLFAVAALVNGGWFASAPRPIAGALTTALGVLAVAGSARIYMIPSQPFWNALWLPCSFLGATLLLGGCGGLLVRNADASRWFIVVLVAGAVLVCVSAVGAALRWGRLRRVRPGPQLDCEPRPLTPGTWLAYGLHVLLAGAVPLALAVNVAGDSAGFLWLAFGCIVLGVVLGRALMYSLPASLARF